jgi:hypothetical protein
LRPPAPGDRKKPVTEAEWLAHVEPQPLLDLVGGRATQRKLRLFACACCRQLWHLRENEGWRQAVEVAEALADGRAKRKEVLAARAAVERANQETRRPHWFIPLGLGKFTVEQAQEYAREAKVRRGEEAALTTPGPYEAWTEAARVAREKAAGEQAAFLRDLVLFTPPLPPPPACLTWEGGTIPRLAQAIYDEGGFDRLAVLADALEDAGCTDAIILGHCRGPGVHVRGSWVIDLLLGKESGPAPSAGLEELS